MSKPTQEQLRNIKALLNHSGGGSGSIEPPEWKQKLVARLDEMSAFSMAADRAQVLDPLSADIGFLDASDLRAIADELDRRNVGAYFAFLLRQLG